MIACVWPHLSHLDQTLSTLKFAARMQIIKNKPTVNESKTSSVASVKLIRQIKALKEELAFHDIIAGRSGILYDEPTQDELLALKDSIRKYVEDESQMPDIMSVQQVKVIFREMRQIIVESLTSSQCVKTPRTPRAVEAKQENARTLRRNVNTIFSAEKVKVEQNCMSPTSDASIQKRTALQQQTFADDATPQGSPSTVLLTNGSEADYGASPHQPLSPNHQDWQQEQRQHKHLKRYIVGGTEIMDKQAEFERFKLHAGKVRAASLAHAKALLKTKKSTIRELTNEINYQKDRIDFLMSQLREAEPTKSKSLSPSSPRGEDPTKQLKVAKKAYRVKMEMLNESKQELKFMQHQKEQCFHNLIVAFDGWLKMKNDGESDEEDPAWSSSPLEEKRQYVNQSPRADPSEAAAYEKAQYVAREKVSSRAAARNARSGEWKI